MLRGNGLRFSQVGSLVVDESDHMPQRREVAQLHVVIARDAVDPANGSHQLRLLDRVNPEVGFEIKVKIQHVLRVAGLFDNQVKNAFLHRIGNNRTHRCRDGCCRNRSSLSLDWWSCLPRGYGLRRSQIGTLVVDESDHMPQRREVAQLHVVIAREMLYTPRIAANSSACLTVSTPRSASRSRSRSSMSFG